jgi:hypothetical protein
MTRPKVAASNDESFQSIFSSTERTQTMNPSNPQPPIREFRIGTVSCAVWRDEVEQDGRTQVRHSFKLKKRYRDRDGNWQDSQTYFPDDVFKAIIVFQQAYEFAMLHEKENGEPAAA